MIGYFIAFIVVGYICGLFESGYFVGKVCGIDIRNYGSGNSGTTNVLRVLGKMRAFLTFMGDALKGFIPVMIVKHIVGPNIGLSGEMLSFAALLIGFAAVMGHDYPFYMHFKGGKGVATTAAVFMAFDWRMGTLCFIIFVCFVAATRYVSLGSIMLSIGLIPEILIFHHGMWKVLAITCLFTYFIVYRHRANIGRLLSGTESKLGQKVKVDLPKDHEDK
ncbi:MAG: glycerol-3-phosphate 1-O-acyltransferase PlsY [Lachnospiraceae bacterium]|nr:glycerol-3-phosphate 1-O-acyltransferase PlsY [Lachnospiraceae bacterium]